MIRSTLSSHEWSCSSALVNYAKYGFMSSTLVGTVSSYWLTKAKGLFSDGINFLECWFLQPFEATEGLTEGGVVCSHVKSSPFLMSWYSTVDSLWWLDTERINTDFFSPIRLMFCHSRCDDYWRVFFFWSSVYPCVPWSWRCYVPPKRR